jgi:hypothetical protein
LSRKPRLNKRETPEEPATESDAAGAIDLPDAGFLEGMSSAAARIVIERNLPANYSAIYDIAELQNQGRYYVAKIVEPPGNLVARLLVDKLNGRVYFPKDKLKPLAAYQTQFAFQKA